MKLVPVALILFLSPNLFAQKTVNVSANNTLGVTQSNLFYTVGGTPVNKVKYVAIVEGSAFYSENYATGNLVLSSGKKYDKMQLKIDMMDHTVHYKVSPEEELIATTPIRTVLLYDAVLEKVLQFDHSDFIPGSKVETGWYQLLDTGTAWLYKRHIKTIRENKPYGSATTEQSIITSYNYYILLNGVLTPVKKLKALTDILPDKKAELQEYINLNSLSGKSDKDYIALVAHYNSLVAKK